MNVAGLRTGTAQQASFPAADSASRTPSPAMRKLENAAREFEGILLANVWRAWNQSNQLGNPQDAIGSSMTDMGIEMASMAIARNGGFGLARMIVNSLKRDVTGQGGKSD